MPRPRIELGTRGFSVVPSGTLVARFIESRRVGLSLLTINRCYREVLRRADEVVGMNVSAQDIQRFLDTRQCTEGGKHSYYRVLRVFYNWLYSRRSGFGLQRDDNPILDVDAPKVGKKILPSLTTEQVDALIAQALCVRDRAIISVFADSGLRLSELARVEPSKIDWERRLIKVLCKGNKEGYAIFGERSEKLLREWRTQYSNSDRLWDVNSNGISIMLRRLEARTGLRCNPHTFRRTFASVLSKRGIDSIHIMRLGRWESIQMVERYTRSVKFEDSLKVYNAVVA